LTSNHQGAGEHIMRQRDGEEHHAEMYDDGCDSFNVFI